jgi:hypothetical protein
MEEKNGSPNKTKETYFRRVKKDKNSSFCGGILFVA